MNRPMIDGSERYPSARRAWFTALFLAVLYCVSYADRLSLSLLVTPIQQDLGIGDVAFGVLIGTAFAALYIIFGVALSPIADRYNRKWLISAGGLIWTISTVLSAFADSFAHLLVLRCGLAVGEAALTPAAISMIGDMFPRDQRAAPTSVYMAAATVGSGGSFLIAGAVFALLSNSSAFMPIAILQIPWRAALFWIGLPGTALVFLFMLTVREPMRQTRVSAGGSGQAARLTRAEWTFFGAFLGAFALYNYLILGVYGWYATIMIRTYGVSVSAAGYYFGMVALIAMGSGALAAPFALRRFRLWLGTNALIGLSLATMILSIPMLVLAVSGAQLPLALSGLAVLMFLMGISSAVPFIGIQLTAPDRLRARLTAFYVLLASILGIGLSPAATGYLAESTAIGGLGHALAAGSITAIAIAILILLKIRRRSNEIISSMELISG